MTSINSSYNDVYNYVTNQFAGQNLSNYQIDYLVNRQIKKNRLNYENYINAYKYANGVTFLSSEGNVRNLKRSIPNNAVQYVYNFLNDYKQGRFSNLYK